MTDFVSFGALACSLCHHHHHHRSTWRCDANRVNVLDRFLVVRGKRQSSWWMQVCQSSGSSSRTSVFQTIAGFWSLRRCLARPLCLCACVDAPEHRYFRSPFLSLLSSPPGWYLPKVMAVLGCCHVDSRQSKYDRFGVPEATTTLRFDSHMFDDGFRVFKPRVRAVQQITYEKLSLEYRMSCSGVPRVQRRFDKCVLFCQLDKLRDVHHKLASFVPDAAQITNSGRRSAYRSDRGIAQSAKILSLPALSLTLCHASAMLPRHDYYHRHRNIKSEQRFFCFVFGVNINISIRNNDAVANLHHRHQQNNHASISRF